MADETSLPWSKKDGEVWAAERARQERLWGTGERPESAIVDERDYRELLSALASAVRSYRELEKNVEGGETGTVTTSRTYLTMVSGSIRESLEHVIWILDGRPDRPKPYDPNLDVG